MRKIDRLADTGFFEFFNVVVWGLVIGLLTGCVQQRAQAGADMKAGFEAARQAAKNPDTALLVDLILAGVEVRIPAATGVNSTEFPQPLLTPAQILADPKKYVDSAPPEPPTRWGWIAAVGGIALPILYGLLKRAPYAGPAIDFLHDVIYPFLVSPKAAAEDREAYSLLAERTRQMAALAPCPPRSAETTSKPAA